MRVDEHAGWYTLTDDDGTVHPEINDAEVLAFVRAMCEQGKGPDVKRVVESQTR